MSTLKVTNIKAADGTSALSIADSSGNVELKTASAKLILPSGGGISFQNHSTSTATGASSTASANVLDDYEEGTCNITLSPNTGFTPTSNVVTGRYTKIGNLVTVTAIPAMTIPSSIGTYVNDSTSYALVISGLPFQIGGDTSFRSAPVIGVFSNIAVVSGVLSGHGNFNSDSISIFVTRDDGGTRRSPTLTVSTTCNFHLCFSYFVA